MLNSIELDEFEFLLFHKIRSFVLSRRNVNATEEQNHGRTTFVSLFYLHSAFFPYV